MGKLNVKKMMKLGMLIMAMVMMFTVNDVSASAAEMLNRGEQTEANLVTFSRINELEINESIEYAVLDSEGNPAIVGIQSVESKARAGERIWRVYYAGSLIDAEFYMTVSNNKVTSVYDDTIMIIAGTYDNDILTKSSTYGKLEFKVELFNANLTKKCWLKGTVTGSNNEVIATWDI